ncbi:precorrin-3B C(17)-methyltransferase [Solirubrobacter ginsenosidimutans]|uniref:Precorrin-3B C(17)-methyltransferase n=1 Tax=Solirubrobacter ginsenosidimutans TaxID=490573 RepID=A0A9X3N0B7_9ACTN|nr:precorrin-3B C(17)-methyltransferase [Solirubrobacter ginsenosidimutans]MDA0162503.1 precorrin-3B C(17)-methyltransferase [Solirubrobacter ginsenosidimutans]
MSGSLSIVGLGPGGSSHRTAAAERAVREADVVIGYGPYVDQCADLLDGQEVVRGRMGEELARAEEAVTRARAGARVALVSSGDAGVHGMAARTLALVAGEAALCEASVEFLALSSRKSTLGDGEGASADKDAAGGGRGAPGGDVPALRVEVIPGVTAALAVAARIGAPLADDWATLSLSDLHVPWATVERRLTALAVSGIALALYNPRSATRTEPFERALAILRAHRPPDTPAIVATDVARPTEAIVTTTLADLDPETVTMRTLVLVAGDTATWAGQHLIARRGGSDPLTIRNRPEQGFSYEHSVEGSDPSKSEGSA